MKELKVSVKKVVERCGAKHNVGDHFYVRGCGTVEIPNNKKICMFALQSIIPFLASKQMEDSLSQYKWVPETKELCCPDPKGVVFQIEPV